GNRTRSKRDGKDGKPGSVVIGRSREVTSRGVPGCEGPVLVFRRKIVHNGRSWYPGIPEYRGFSGVISRRFVFSVFPDDSYEYEKKRK
ncbi:MAG: hypothetical protein Q4C47_04990, partial [Planctomycetia bacterium]|nr:hypothetical protein [Planctomycetia bacterium]